MNDNLMASSPTAWVTLNGLQTENQKLLEFRDHRFLIDLYEDLHPDIVVRKSAQVGESVERILKTFWCNKYLKANVIYVLPTKNVVGDFVAPKVNPLITSNPIIDAMVSKNSESVKQVGDRFTYFKGAFSERDAISISGDILILDELDRMPDMKVVNTYDSRLQASSLGYRWRLSNPSQIGYGVDGLYQTSDQLHWFMQCSRCNHRWYIDFAKSDELNHYIDIEQKIYCCGKCHRELSDKDRRNGEWIAKYPGRRRRGYWISQLMAPWVTAERILEQREDSSIEFFHNYVLGKAYTPSDLVVNRETILRACAPSTIQKLGVVIGVDQNANEQIWTAWTLDGMFAYGKTTSWEDFERLKLQWNAMVVSDPNPYPTMPKHYAEKYNDWYLCYFKQQDGLNFTTWKNKVVYADRTRLLDTVANEITEGKLLFRQRPYELEEYIADWSNIYRTTVEKDDGRVKSEWLKKEGKNSDYSFATAYARLGLSRMIRGSSSLVDPNIVQFGGGITTPMESNKGSIGDAVSETFDRLGV